MKSSRLEKDNIMKNAKNLFRLKKENKAIKNRIVRDIRNLVEHEEDYYKPLRVGNSLSNNYIEYESIVIEIKHYHLKNISIKLDHI